MPRFQLTQHIFCRRIVYAQNAIWILFTFLIGPILIGCATSATSTSFEPTSINEVRFRDRTQSKHDDDVRVMVAVPSAEETKALFSANLTLKEIQPIWVKVENHSDRTFYLISAATDPNYFSPNEAAFSVHGGLSRPEKAKMETYFRSMRFRNPILPQTAVSGLFLQILTKAKKHAQ